MKRSDISKLLPDASDDLISAIMDLNGADINAAKKGADELRKQLDDANAKIGLLEEAARTAVSTDEMKKVVDKAAALEAELNSMKLAEQVRTLRETVANETGVPASLLTGETEDALRDQAKSLLAYKNDRAYPSLRDAGEAKVVLGAQTSKTRDQFANWASENL